MAGHGIIGIDLGGTKTLATLFDQAFAPIDTVKFKTEAGGGVKTFGRKLTETLENLLKVAKKKDLPVTVVGIGCAGHIDSQVAQIRASLNIPFLNDYPLADKVASITGAPVFLGNDAHMGLYGEHQLGAAVGMKHVLGVFLGTGIGGAMIIDGKLHVGSHGLAGDIGHYLVQPLGPLGGSHHQGLLDDFASRTAIAASAVAYASKQWAPELLKLAGTDLCRVRSSVLAESIRKGDKKIEELVRNRTRIVGIVLSNLVDFMNPDMVVLGGGLVDEMPALILEEVEGGIRDHCTTATLEHFQIKTAKLEGQAVAAGAAKMAWDSRR